MKLITMMQEGAKSFFSAHKKEIFFVFLIFLLAFGVRGQLMVYDLMFEFDSYFHARIGEYVAKTLTIPAYDPGAYYQLAAQGGADMPREGAFFWIFSVALFKIFTLNATFNKESWIVAIKIMPALFGALACIGLYFLGREMYGKKVGAVIAIVAAAMPAFAYRTMAGWFEDDSIGFMWMVFGFYFFVRAIKSAELNRFTIINSFLAGLFFTFMGWSWGGFITVPLILGGYLLFTLAMLWFRKESFEKIKNIAINFAIVFLVFSVLVTAVNGSNWITTTTGYLTKYLPVDAASIGNIQSGGNSQSSVYSITVGEEQHGFKFWGNKYSALILLPFLAIPLLLYRLLRKKDDIVSPIFLFWILLTMVMAFTKLKFTFYFGIPVAMSAGIVINEFLEYMGKMQSFEKKIVAMGFGFIMLVGIAAGMFFVPQNVPQIEENTGWKESLYWLKDNTPAGSKMFNWWDEGHWISFIGERNVITDNRNKMLSANAAVASFLLAPTEGEATAIVKKYGSDYVIVSEDLVGKMGSLGLYAFGVADSRTDDYFSQQISCQIATDSLTKQKTFNCGNNTLTEAQYMALPSIWISEPNQTIGQTQRAFVYRNESANSLFLLNKAANEAFVTKLFFAPDAIQNFELVYSNKQVRVYKVK